MIKTREQYEHIKNHNPFPISHLLETIEALRDVARAGKMAWGLLDIFQPNAEETDRLFQTLSALPDWLLEK